MRKENCDDFQRLTCQTTIQAEKDGYYAFEETVFWGEKGGALPDEGTINGLPVLDLKWEGNTLWHKVDGTLSDPISMIVDPEVRLTNTAIQSALHLLDGYYRKRGSVIIAIGVHPDHQWYEVDEKNLTDQDLAEAQAYMNQAIYDQVPVSFSYVEGKDFPDPDYQDFDFVRLVRFGDLDEQPCSTPHLNHTGQIGSFVILDKENTSRGTRILVSCNRAADHKLQASYQQLKAIQQALRCKEDELVDRVQTLVDGEKKQKDEIAKLQAQLSQYQAADLAQSTDHVHVLEGLDGGALRSLGQSLLSQISDSRILLSEKEGKCSLLIVSADNKARDILATLKEDLPVRGGGSPQLVNGQVDQPLSAVQEALSKLSF